LCPECFRKYTNDRYHKNKDKILAARRRRRKEGKVDKKAERTYHREYARNNKQKRRKYRETLNFFLAELVNRSKRSATKRGKIHNIDVEFLRSLWQLQDGRCAITNMPMSHKTRDLRSMSIDRIDSEKGYIKGNIQLVCKWVNFAKSNHSLDEIKTILKEFKDV